MIDQEKIKRAVALIIEAIGEDATREGLVETPRRIAEMYAELFDGLQKDPLDVLKVWFKREGPREMVILKNIPFYSMCEHHFLPFHGVAHIGYIPNERIVGISKLARVVEILAHRPQLQERLTGQIADAIMEGLQPQGVGVVIEAEHLCYDQETEILTNKGWRKFAVLTDEQVAQVDPQTLEMTFTQPLAKIAYRYSGPMYRYHSDCVDLLVTPDHRMLLKSDWHFYKGGGPWRFVPARAIPIRGRYIIPQACSWSGTPIPATYELAGRKVASDDYLRFMGIWLSEGCAYEKPGHKGYTVVVSQAPGEVADKIRALFDRLPWNWWENSTPSGIRQFIISDKALCEFLAPFGKSGNKFIPTDIKNATPEQLRLFLEWYGMGDGHHYKDRPLRWQYVSKSPQLIDDIQEILVRLGIAGGLQSYSNCARIETRTHKRKEGAGYKWYAMLLPKHRSVVDYEGMVYCVTVPTSAVLVRRNGKTAVSGNCMTMRGIKKPGSIVVTSANRGLFRRNLATRQEFLSLVHSSKGSE